MQIEINPATVTSWRTAKKTGTLVAMLGSVVIQYHPRLAAKLKLNTLEGDEPINPAAMVCIGEQGDAWQQALPKLLKKYDLSGITDDGWVRYTPKPGPEAEIDTIQITEEMIGVGNTPIIKGCHWGIKQDDGSYNQLGKTGSWLARLKHDLSDFYFIDDLVFRNTYSLV